MRCVMIEEDYDTLDAALDIVRDALCEANKPFTAHDCSGLVAHLRKTAANLERMLRERHVCYR